MNDPIKIAIQTLQQGGLVAIPSETVYGLSCDPHNEQAVLKLFTVKKRPHSKPLNVLLPDPSHVLSWASKFPNTAKKLAKQFWPGPLTLILPKKNTISESITANLNSIGLRVPNHSVSLNLLTQFGIGLPATSANPYNGTSPTTSKAVLESLGTQVDYILEGGTCTIGLESTIVSCLSKTPVILREGALSRATLSHFLKTDIPVRATKKY